MDKINCDNDKCEIDSDDKGKEVGVDLDLEVSEWINTDGRDINLKDLRGKVVVIEVFQIFCPACVTHGLPQIGRLHRIFQDETRVYVLGLHSVFEHHEVMQKESLKVFLSEFRYSFPVAIDKSVDGKGLPATMRKFGLMGTPSLIIIDQNGKLQEILFGAIDDLSLGLKIGKMLK